MKRSIDIGRWTITKAALAIAGALAIGGAVGSALAISPTVPAPIKWAAAVEIFQGSTGVTNALYAVPAGKILMLTDVIVSNNSSTKARFNLDSTNSACSDVLPKLVSIVVPPESTYALSLQTGMGFATGRSVCFHIAEGTLAFNARGFLFTPN
jgi:hypothetical protein